MTVSDGQVDCRELTVNGFPATVTVTRHEGDPHPLHMAGRFSYGSQEYGVDTVLDSMEEVDLCVQLFTVNVRRKLGELGAIVWPPPPTDPVAWGFPPGTDLLTVDRASSCVR